MSQDSARFQARSAYTGVGFTTYESEQVADHPVRRKIVMALMLTGNIGIAVVIASMMATFAQNTEDTRTWTVRLVILAGSLLGIWMITTQKFVDQAIEKLIAWSLKKWTQLDVRDYVSLLHLAEGFVVYEITANPDDWITGKTLAEAKLSNEGVLVLGIHRKNGKYIGSPYGRSLVNQGDVLTLYGTSKRLEELDTRKAGSEGDEAHEAAMIRQVKQEQITEIEDSI
ncbi:MAG: TrkA C-terminal domain-containing protein [Planctomycetota bacterium]